MSSTTLECFVLGIAYCLLDYVITDGLNSAACLGFVLCTDSTGAKQVSLTSEVLKIEIILFPNDRSDYSLASYCTHTEFRGKLCVF